MEKAELLLKLMFGTKVSTNSGPSETKTFVVLHQDVYSAHRMPNGWRQGSPCHASHMRVTIELPEHVHDGFYGMANLNRLGLYCDYSNDLNGHGCEVLAWCDVLPVAERNYKEAFDAAARTIKLEIPQKDGKHSIIVPAKVVKTEILES